MKFEGGESESVLCTGAGARAERQRVFVFDIFPPVQREMSRVRAEGFVSFSRYFRGAPQSIWLAVSFFTFYVFLFLFHSRTMVDFVFYFFFPFGE